jgi:hypothetical protein
MQAAPNGFNANESLLPDVKVPINGVQGGGGVNTFLSDFFLKSVGLPIQYKSRGDANFTEFIIPSLPMNDSDSKSDLELDIQEEPESKPLIKKLRNPNKLQAAQKIAINNIKKIKNDEISSYLVDAVNNATDIQDILTLESLLPKIDKGDAIHVKVIGAVSKDHGVNKSDLIKQIIKVLTTD